MLDYRGNVLNVGNTVKNIESGWRGVVQTTEGEGSDLLLVCLGVNWWDGELDLNDKQWHAPGDVTKQVRREPQPNEAPNGLNLL